MVSISTIFSTIREVIMTLRDKLLQIQAEIRAKYTKQKEAEAEAAWTGCCKNIRLGMTQSGRDNWPARSYSRQDGRSKVEASNVYDLGLNREDIKRVGDGNAILTSSDLGLRRDILVGNIP